MALIKALPQPYICLHTCVPHFLYGRCSTYLQSIEMSLILCNTLKGEFSTLIFESKRKILFNKCHDIMTL